MATLLFPLLLTLSASDTMPDLYESRQITYTGGIYSNQTLKYRLLKPVNGEAGKKYPLVIFLHGAGERGDDNVKSLLYFPTWMAEPANRKQFPCFILVPQCPEERMWIDRHWSLEKHEMSPEPADELKAVIQMIQETWDKEAVDRDRVYLTGLSMGGYGSWELACRHPDWFAAAAPVCGGGDEKQAAKLVDLPIWAWHGGADPAVNIERSRRMIEAITAAGGHPRLTELAYVGHNSWSPAYHSADLLTWMFAQTRAKKR